MRNESVDLVAASAREIQRRRALSAFAAREMADAADAVARWLAGDGKDSDQEALVERLRGSVDALAASEHRAPPEWRS